MATSSAPILYQVRPVTTEWHFNRWKQSVDSFSIAVIILLLLVWFSNRSNRKSPRRSISPWRWPISDNRSDWSLERIYAFTCCGMSNASTRRYPWWCPVLLFSSVPASWSCSSCSWRFSCCAIAVPVINLASKRLPLMPSLGRISRRTHPTLDWSITNT